MANLTKITRTVLQLSGVPQNIVKSAYFYEDCSSNSYIEHRITPHKEQSNLDEDFTFDNWVIGEYPELEGQTILIYIG